MDHESKSDYDNIESEASSDSDPDWMSDAKPVDSNVDNDIEDINQVERNYVRSERSLPLEMDCMDDAKPLYTRAKGTREDCKSLGLLTLVEKYWIRDHSAFMETVPLEAAKTDRVSSCPMILCGSCKINLKGYRMDSLAKHYQKSHNLHIVDLPGQEFAILKPDEVAKCRTEISAEQTRLSELLLNPNFVLKATRKGDRLQCPYCWGLFKGSFCLRNHRDRMHSELRAFEIPTDKTDKPDKERIGDVKPVESRVITKGEGSPRVEWKALTHAERDWIRTHPVSSPITLQHSVSSEPLSMRKLVCERCDRSPEGRSPDNLVTHYRRVHDLYIVALKNGKYAMFTPDEMAKYRSEISAEEARLKQDREGHCGTTAHAIKVGNKWECPHCASLLKNKSNLRKHGKRKHPYKATIDFPSAISLQ